MLPAAAVAQAPAASSPASEGELACVYDALAPAQRNAVAIAYSADSADGRARVAAALSPSLAACAARHGWDDSRRRWAGDYAGQRAEAEARAAALPAVASAERLRALFAALPEADRRGMGAGAEIDDAAFRAIGVRLKAAFEAASIPPEAQGPAAGYLLAFAHLREIQAAWTALPRR